MKCLCDSEESYSVVSLSLHSLLSSILRLGRQQEKPSIHFLLSIHSERLAGEHGGACRHTHSRQESQRWLTSQQWCEAGCLQPHAGNMLCVSGWRPLLAAFCSSSCVDAPKEPLEANKGANVIKRFTLTEQTHTSGWEWLCSSQNDALTASIFLFLSHFPLFQIHDCITSTVRGDLTPPSPPTDSTHWCRL